MGRARHAALGRRARAGLRADPAFAHLVVYTAPGADFLCVEPVSNVADAFNLAAAGDGRTGMRVLAPGERYSASLRMDFQLGKPGAIRR